MSDSTKGFLALLAANVVWGLSPLVYKALDHVPPVELLSHRILWSLVFFGALLALQRRLRAVGAALRDRAALWRLGLAAICVTFNWGVFIWAIQVERAMEASLGYYIFPLLSVVLGMAIFREGRAPGKLLAFGLACAAVLVLTLGLGAAPWMAVSLALSFAAYSLLKKTSATGPIVSVTAEVALMAPLALAWLVAVQMSGMGAFGVAGWDSALLMLSGPLTAAPLVLFSYASTRLSFATIGLVFYVNPSLQLFVAAVVFQELFTIWHGLALPMIWLALAIYSGEALYRERAARRAATSAGMSSQSVT